MDLLLFYYEGVVRTKRKSHKTKRSLILSFLPYKPEEAARNENFVPSLLVGLYCMFAINQERCPFAYCLTSLT